MADMQPVFMETFNRCIDPSQPFYTLFGVRVEGSYHGIVIQNGRTYLRYFVPKNVPFDRGFIEGISMFHRGYVFVSVSLFFFFFALCLKKLTEKFANVQFFYYLCSANRKS